MKNLLIIIVLICLVLSCQNDKGNEVSKQEERKIYQGIEIPLDITDEELDRKATKNILGKWRGISDITCEPNLSQSRIEIEFGDSGKAIYKTFTSDNKPSITSIKTYKISDDKVLWNWDSDDPTKKTIIGNPKFEFISENSLILYYYGYKDSCEIRHIFEREKK